MVHDKNVHKRSLPYDTHRVENIYAALECASDCRHDLTRREIHHYVLFTSACPYHAETKLGLLRAEQVNATLHHFGRRTAIL